MIELKRESFNDALQNCNKILIFCYRKNHGESILGFDLISEIDKLIAKDFEIFTVDIESEFEIADLLSVEDVPEYICIKNSKIHKRAIQLKYTNQILDLLK